MLRWSELVKISMADMIARLMFFLRQAVQPIEFPCEDNKLEQSLHIDLHQWSSPTILEVELKPERHWKAI